MKTVQIGQILLERGIVTAPVLEKALRGARGRICSALLDSGAATEEALARALSEKHGVPGVDLSRTVIAGEVLDLIPRRVAEADLILPLSTDGGRLHLALPAPAEADRAVTEVRFVTGREVSPYVAVVASLRRAISAAYVARARGAEVWRGGAAAGAVPHLAFALPETLADVPGDDVLDVQESDLEPVGDEGEVPEIEVEVGGTDEVVVDTIRSRPGPVRILVVDDEPEIRMLLERTLLHRGYEVEVAVDGEEGLGKIESGRHDLVLLDAMLPRLHGFEICRRVKSNPSTRTLPVIMMTAIYRGWRFAQDARETYGADDYVEKPFHAEDLLRRISAALESKGDRAASEGISAEPAFRRGRELLVAGQLAAATESFEQAIRLDPYSADAHFHLAKTLRAQGDAFRAMSAYERAVELRPSLFPALRSLAALYTEKGFRSKAAETLERALKVAPDAATREAIRGDLMKLL